MPKPDKSLIDVVLPQPSGYPPELARLDTREALMMAAQEGGAKAATDFPDSLWIEKKDWPDWVQKNNENKTWGLDYLDRFTNQDPTHECTCHSLRANMEAAWNRQRRISLGGPAKGQRLPISEKSASVWLSPLSVYAEANPRQWGGANVQQVLRIAANRGMLPETIQPRNYGFKHALHGTTGKGGVNQAKGPWTSVSRFPEGWKETAKHFKPLEFVFPENVDQAVCLLLHGFLVSVGRSGHAIPWAKYDLDENLFPYPDSYDVIRYDSWNTARNCAGNGSFAIISVTQPDDWDFPAGKAA